MVQVKNKTPATINNAETAIFNFSFIIKIEYCIP